MSPVLNGAARGSPATAGPAAATAPTRLAAPRQPAPAAALAAPASTLAGAVSLAAAAARRRGIARAGLAVLAGPAGLALADLAALAGAAAAAGIAVPLALLFAVIVAAVLASGGLYRVRITPRVSDQAGRVVAAVAVAALAVLAWLPSTGALRLALISAGLLLAGRLAAQTALLAARRRGLVAEPVLVIGTGATGQQIAADLAARPELGLRLTGFLDSRTGPAGAPADVLGTPAELTAVLRQHRIRRVIVAFAADRDAELVGVLRAARELPADVWVVPRLHEVGTSLPRARRDEVWGTPLVPLRRRSRAGQLGKRAFDVAAASVLLLLAAPLLLVLAAAVRVRLRRPALFRQVRVTGQGRLAEIVKLRTVTVSGDPDTCWVVPPQRATALGRFLRATHLDELPQLASVIRGDMSLVGPRPERPYFATRFEREVPGYPGRHRVSAGLTGWAQVHGLNGDTSIRDRARFDNAYIEDWSFWLDLVIIARTIAGSLAALATNRDDGLSRAARQNAAPPAPDPAPSGPACHIPTAGGQR
ncbi:MAG: exopolysaccharide biosynthesis polyprenyl glycosylphosphotransferase [Gemmatimonadota bacterium]